MSDNDWKILKIAQSTIQLEKGTPLDSVFDPPFYHHIAQWHADDPEDCETETIEYRIIVETRIGN